MNLNEVCHSHSIMRTNFVYNVSTMVDELSSSLDNIYLGNILVVLLDEARASHFPQWQGRCLCFYVIF